MTTPSDPVMSALEAQVTALEAAAHQAKIAMFHRHVQFTLAADLLKRAAVRLADLQDDSALLGEIGVFLAEGTT